LLRRYLNFFLIVLISIGFVFNVDAYVEKPTEYQIKAALLYYFTKFVEWPQESLPETGKTLTIGVLGNSPILTSLEAIEGKKTKGRMVVVKHFKRPAEVEFCHLLFISSSEEAHLVQILNKVKDWNTLTVSESEVFLRRGGMINFILVDQKVRFEINESAVGRTGLMIAPNLLKLAL